MNKELEKQKVIAKQKENFMKHEEEMEVLRHNNIMFEIQEMGKNKIVHLDRRK